MARTKVKGLFQRQPEPKSNKIIGSIDGTSLVKLFQAMDKFCGTLSGNIDCIEESLDMKLCIVKDVVDAIKAHKSQRNVGDVFISRAGYPTRWKATREL
jgi:hypothetical protein